MKVSSDFAPCTVGFQAQAWPTATAYVVNALDSSSGVGPNSRVAYPLGPP